jgi:putative acetyltransferase
MTEIAIESPFAPGVRELLAASDEFHFALYPPHDVFLLDESTLDGPGITVVVARVDGEAVGMGALVEKADFAEVKRMYLHKAARGSGAADGILTLLEKVAREHGVTELRLETGQLQPAAIRFYERNGFTEIPLFGEYVDSENSVCFAKELPAG